MNRRQWLACSSAAGLPLLPSGARAAYAQPAVEKLAPLKITDVKAILTQPSSGHFAARSSIRTRMISIAILFRENAMKRWSPCSMACGY